MSGTDCHDLGARGAAALPIVSHYATKLAEGERAALADLAARVAAEEPNLSAIPPLDPQLGTGRIAAPSLLVEDHSGILLALAHVTDAGYTYRALLLAGEGDMLAVYGARNPAFEAYCRDVLRLGRVEALTPAPGEPPRPLSLACAEDAAFVERVARTARAAGGLNVVPYMATGGIWRLAGEIAQKAGVPVRVAGPPPKLARRVNDKLWFARRAAEVLGREAVPPSTAVYGMAALVGRVRRLGRRHDSVALKLTHASSSLGNLVLDTAEIAGLSPLALRERLGVLMRQVGWRQEFPLQVTAWEGPLVASPSAQLWIPLQGEGPPVVEGVFDQIVSGRAARFVGAVPSGLPIFWRRRIAFEAARLGTLFQHLGYFGRCSFDAVLVGRTDTRGRLHWVECNGRWGGVSIPMTLANRLTGDWAAGGFLVMIRRLEGLRAKSTADFLKRFADALYRPGVAPAGAVLLSPGPLDIGKGIDLLILGRDAADARERGEALLARLTG